MNTQNKISSGSVLAVIGGVGIALSAILGWTSLVRPWSFLLGFILGVAAGVGVVLVIAGFIERRHSS
jgi:zinc transporter ZupT